MPSVRMERAIPTQKVWVSGFAGACATVMIYFADEYWLQVPLPAEIAAAVTVIITTLIGYFIPPSPRDRIVVADTPPAGP